MFQLKKIEFCIPRGQFFIEYILSWWVQLNTPAVTNRLSLTYNNDKCVWSALISDGTIVYT